jgi:hypothetical protein
MRKKILITSKTYPLPSKTYLELVCTAGITEEGEWIRLYPIPFRYNSYDQQFPLFSWVECEVKRRTEDSRMESHSPIGDISVGEKILTKNKWEERKSRVLPLLDPSIEELKELCPSGRSMGLIKPREITRIYAVETGREWDASQQEAIVQQNLFEQRKPLEKIPYDFKYDYFCQGASCKGHSMRVEDWGLGVLYRKMRDQHGEKEAVNKVIQKMKWASETDLHLFVGTQRNTHHYGTFTIIGLFTPPILSA